MRKSVSILFILLYQLTQFLSAGQGPAGSVADTFNFGGQLSLWANYNRASVLPVITGVRYIPAINYGINLDRENMLDFEASANLTGAFSFNPFDKAAAEARLNPYRFWVRYSADQLEVRLGLQKINFGSASMLRPLMWFDQMDPRDPLHLTNGVWGLLARYFFMNNANVWVWGLYGNNDPRGWESVPSNSRIPEFGGRLQVPVPKGEAAISYHHRTADNREMLMFNDFYDKIPEDKFGLDAKWDLVTGLWIEGTWTRKRENLGIFTNQEILNAGIDYTFGLGSGLYIACEQLLMSMDEKPFGFTNRNSLSLLTVSYPLGLFDKIGAIVYYSWTDNSVYNFISWHKQLDNIMFYLMGYWNPEIVKLPSQSGSQSLFSGKGIQIMFVLNH